MAKAHEVNRQTYVRNDLAEGKRIGHWLLLRRLKNVDKTRHDGWLCRCDCGTEKYVQVGNLLTGASSRCFACAGAARRRYVIGDQVGTKTIIGRLGTAWLVLCKCGWLGEQPGRLEFGHRGCPLTVWGTHGKVRSSSSGKAR